MNELIDIYELVNPHCQNITLNEEHGKKNTKNRKNASPLSGRQVMIPLTSKAFLPGVLRPPLMKEDYESSNSVKAKNEVEREVIIMNLTSVADIKSNGFNRHGKFGGEKKSDENKNEGDDYVDMTRLEAAEYLKKKMKVRSSSLLPSLLGCDVSEEINSEVDLSLNSYKHSTAGDRTGNNVSQKEELTAARVPFFEIREEYDMNGNEIKSEAIDISKELKYLTKKNKEGLSMEENNNFEESLHKRRGTSATDVNHKIDKKKIASATLTLHKNIPVESECSQGYSSEEWYGKTLSKLDQLALQESLNDDKAKENAKSSRKLQSKGWAKGFLNTSTKNSRRLKNEKTESSREAHVKGTASKVKEPSLNEKVLTSDRKQVQFLDERNQSDQTNDQHNAKVNENKTAVECEQPIPFTSKVFTGLINERPVNHVQQNEEAKQQYQTIENFNKIAVSSDLHVRVSGESKRNTQPPSRKASRFAQQRQRRHDL
mmetsp:Transcript_50258/g.60452  ORF Transcript_50258/g.60452 Transcript_50258/m.60452 type:complete len:486 (+) Transcript_50258:238-1695(+)|eukprot:CAMPEP_0194372448 /NCGR_PEP_ID=MMETSP0174-20130528/20812_1 /TAXON_ID=216777 /ORGANISM="Proboscia alata, Strain PI-D3" /LENGTH=485 /DNA_ID=CAMNT_0039150989 /DNA_START=224 /DNA_END=1681 /DNA_ORIENTATION=+